jgi:ParB/RepB/Spo0J family partition protein
MQTQNVPLVEIYPSASNPRKHFDEASLKELASSIIKHDVIQPVTLRLKPVNGHKYELVCGERRFKASALAKKETIPAIVRELTDDEVLDLQFTENLHRQDVHPMDEAVTFKAMLETNRYTIADIAAKVAKPETFVVQRLSLNNLIEPLQKEFWAGKFLIGQAALISRLAAEDQKLISKECRTYVDGNKKELSSINSLKDFIARNITRQLTAAPFDKNDAELFPEAGACVTCVKRSGCNKLLFPDVKEDDRCFDASCFETKIDRHLLKTVEKVLNEQPEIKFMEHRNYYSPKPVLPSIVKLAEKFGVPILNYNNSEISTWKRDGAEKIKVLIVSGDEAGKFTEVYLYKGGKKTTNAEAKAAAKAGNLTPELIDEQIAGIKQRQKRALEIDQQHIWDELKENFKPSKNIELVSKAGQFSQAERNAIAQAMIKKLGYSELEEFKKAFKGSSKLDNVTDAQLREITRYFFLASLPPTILYSGYNTEAKLCLEVANQYFPKVRKDIEDKQAELTAKRIANANKRIAELQAQKTSKVDAQKKRDEKKSAKSETKKAKTVTKPSKSATKKTKSVTKKASAKK